MTGATHHPYSRLPIQEHSALFYPDVPLECAVPDQLPWVLGITPATATPLLGHCVSETSPAWPAASARPGQRSFPLDLHAPLPKPAARCRIESLPPPSVVLHTRAALHLLPKLFPHRL